MRILSWNVNGIRSVVKKCFLEWLQEDPADIVCLQEIKAQEDDIPNAIKALAGYQLFLNPSARKGHAGVAILSRHLPTNAITTLGHERFDFEGRIIELQFPGLSVINIYIPHGGRGRRDLQYKLEVYDALLESLRNRSDQQTVLIGDFNIAHADEDLRRPTANRQNIMFTSSEREMITRLLACGYIDSFRRLNPKAQQYTWWSYMKGVRERDIGWRIDYAFVSTGLSQRIKSAAIHGGVPGSDHCPISIELE